MAAGVTMGSVRYGGQWSCLIDYRWVRECCFTPTLINISEGLTATHAQLA